MELKNKTDASSNAEVDVLAEELKRVSLELERANKDLEHFAYIVSHDLREPLRMVLKFTELIIKKFRNKIGTEADEYLGFITEGINRMQLIIDDLLKYSKINTTNREFSEINCNEILEQVILSLHPAIKETKTVINYDDLPCVNGNTTALAQVFRYLIDNSIKFRKVTSTPIIHISCTDEGSFWKFLVKDNGIGIDPKFREKIFVIFQKLHGNKEYTGSGSGLAITKRIVELHGGEIWVESEPGNGASFYFTLPKIKVKNCSPS